MPSFLERKCELQILEWIGPTNDFQNILHSRKFEMTEPRKAPHQKDDHLINVHPLPYLFLATPHWRSIKTLKMISTDTYLAPPYHHQFCPLWEKSEDLFHSQKISKKSTGAWENEKAAHLGTCSGTSIIISEEYWFQNRWLKGPTIFLGFKVHVNPKLLLTFWTISPQQTAMADWLHMFCTS